MPSLGSDRVAAPTTILSAIGSYSSLWSASLIHLLRCSALASFSTRTLGFGTYLSHAHDPYDSRIARICFFGKGLSRSV